MVIVLGAYVVVYAVDSFDWRNNGGATGASVAGFPVGDQFIGRAVDSMTGVLEQREHRISACHT